MNIPWFIFILLLAMCLVVGISFFAPQVPFEEVVLEDGSTQRVIKSHGYTHEKFSTMFEGGPGAERHAVTFWIGWVFAMLCIVFFVVCVLLGAERGGSLGPFKVPFAIGTVLYAAIFSCVLFTYHGYMGAASPDGFLGFPAPTAWMMYGVWPIPIYFVVLYSLYFDRWYFTAEDEARFEALLAENGQGTAQDT
jgi:hypothetical protein